MVCVLLATAAECSGVQPMAFFAIGVRAGLQQAFHGDGGLGGGRQVQGGLSVSFAAVGISAGIEKLVGAFCRAIGSGFMERSAAGFRAVVRAGALLNQGLRE